MLQEHMERALDDHLTGFGYLVDPTNYILQFVNPPLCNRSGMKGEDWQGKLCYELLHQRKKPCPFCKIGQIQGDVPLSWYHYDEILDAHLAVNDFMVSIEGKPYFMETSYEITPVMKEILNLREQMAASEAVIACANTLLEGADAISELLGILMQFFHGDYAYIFERDEISHTTRLSYSVRRKEHTTLTDRDFEKCYPYDENSTWTQDLLQNDYIFLEASELETSSFPYRDRLFSTSENSNVLMAPLTIHGNLIGVLGVNNLKDNIAYLSLITTVTSFVANSLGIQYTYSSLEETVNNLESRNLLNQAILDCVTTLVSDENLSEAVEQLLAIICEYFQGKGAYILSTHPEAQEVFCQFFHMEGDALSIAPNYGTSIGVFHKLFEEFVLSCGNVAYVSQVATQMSGIYPQELVDVILERGVSSFYLVPMKEEEHCNGYIWVDEPSSDLVDVSLLSTVSAFVVNHMHRDQLLKKLELLSYTDSMTGVYNRNYYNSYTEELQRKSTKAVGIIFADVNGLKKANDHFGHELGDILLSWSGLFFKTHVDGVVCRFGGDEFVSFVIGEEESVFYDRVDDLRQQLSHYGDVHISIGAYWVDQARNMDLEVKEADQRMYLEKQQYYQAKNQDTRTVKDELADFSASVLALQKELE